jgi:hypothetical protein
MAMTSLYDWRISVVIENKSEEAITRYVQVIQDRLSLLLGYRVDINKVILKKRDSENIDVRSLIG